MVSLLLTLDLGCTLALCNNNKDTTLVLGVTNKNQILAHITNYHLSKNGAYSYLSKHVHLHKFFHTGKTNFPIEKSCSDDQIC